MPYLITTKRHVKRVRARRIYWDDIELSRRAVGTLDEAREVAWENVVDAGADLNIDRAPFRAAVELSESGGTVGPLPDGTVVEVEPTEWGDLVHAGRLDRDADDEQLIIATYNAAQED